jgi:D-sedoheptulose 7-phosphate isomerase
MVSSDERSSSKSRLYFERLASLVPLLPYEAMDRIVEFIVRACRQDRTIFVFGNGGSAASASHMICDLSKGARQTAETVRIKALALTDNVPLLTAWGNDLSYEHVFSEQLKNFLKPGDVVLALSCTGNSANVLAALRTARHMGAVTAALAGFDGGVMKALCHVCAIVPCDNMQMIEDLHQAMLHSICSSVSQYLRDAKPARRVAAAG